MTEARRKPTFAAMRGGLLFRERLRTVADGLAVALVLSLPWSTSGTSILAAAWLIAVLPILEPAHVRHVLRTAAGGLPVLLWLLGVGGMLWAQDVPLSERIDGLSSFHKLLFIPLLMAQFLRSERAHWVLIGFLASCTALLAVSWGLFAHWSFNRDGAKTIAVPVKDYIAQGAEFGVAMMLLAAIALRDWPVRRMRAVLLSALALAFGANVVVIASARTALVAIPALIVLFAFVHLHWKTALGFLAAAAGLLLLVWSIDPYVRADLSGLVTEIREFRPESPRTRAGERLEYWRKSVEMVAEAPIVGHGTGAIRSQFRMRAQGEDGAASLVTPNPHNQILAIAVQLGILGAVALLALWIAHLWLFWSAGPAAWAGLLVVSQNIIGSMFNSHLFDFTHGWGYVIGVGVAGGVMLRRAGLTQDQHASASQGTDKRSFDQLRPGA